MRAEGHAALSICRVLREQDCQIAARTYRSHRQGHASARTVTDAHVQDAVRSLAWKDVEHDDVVRRVLTPEGLYGRRKMTALVRRRVLPDASRGAVDRAMRALGLSEIRRDKRLRTTIPAKDPCRRSPQPGLQRTAAGPHVGDGLHRRTHLGQLGPRRVHRRRLHVDRLHRPAHRRRH